MAETENNTDDRRLFNLIDRYNETAKTLASLEARAAKLRKVMPSTMWTTEEMTTHRIQRRTDTQRFISVLDIETADEEDRPGRPSPEMSMAQEGTAKIITIIIRPQEPTAEEVAAWTERCAARRALYDAKRSAAADYDKAVGQSALDDEIAAKIDERDALAAEIGDCHPTTLAGVIGKMKISWELVADSMGGDTWLEGMAATALTELARVDPSWIAA